MKKTVVISKERLETFLYEMDFDCIFCPCSENCHSYTGSGETCAEHIKEWLQGGDHDGSDHE